MNHNYCLEKRALHFLYNDYESDYEHILLMSNKPSIEVRKLRFLAVEIFKTINDLYPSYMKEIVTLNTTRDVSSNKLYICQNSKHQKKYIYGTDSLRSLGPRIWNNLSNEIRISENLFVFKTLIKTWSGP